jgi:hypothetical protein
MTPAPFCFRVPAARLLAGALALPHPVDGYGVVADGLGSRGNARDVCVPCHRAAGEDPDHPGRDFVYTQVR